MHKTDAYIWRWINQNNLWDKIVNEKYIIECIQNDCRVQIDNYRITSADINVVFYIYVIYIIIGIYIYI